MNRQQLKRFIDREAEEVEIYDIIQACAKRLKWNIAIEEGQENVRGLIIGNDEYMNAHLPEEVKSTCKPQS